MNILPHRPQLNLALPCSTASSACYKCLVLVSLQEKHQWDLLKSKINNQH